MALEWLINLHCVRSWNAKFDERGDVAGFEALGSQGGSVAQSLASGTASAAHSLAAPRDSGFNQPTQTLVQEVAAMTQQECRGFFSGKTCSVDSFLINFSKISSKKYLQALMKEIFTHKFFRACSLKVLMVLW